MRNLKFIVLFCVLSSCVSTHEDKRSVYIDLVGKQLDIYDEPVFEIVYANDTLMIASLLSPTHVLSVYYPDKRKEAYEFLRVGRGPMEVNRANVKSREDTLYVLSHNSYGLQGEIRIPVSAIEDMSQWDYTDYSIGEMFVGRDFDVKSSSENIIAGGIYGEENILSALQRGKSSCESLNFWPKDGCSCSVVPKQTLYIRGAKVFCNGEKILYACGDGRYFSILDFSSGYMTETCIYDDYPHYTVASDGINPNRLSDSAVGGIVYATDSFIYLSPFECHIVNGRYVPDNYKGYPPYYNDRIEVYDWNGDYIYTYRLDIPFSTFYVTDDDCTLYTASCEIETGISTIFKYPL